MQHSSAQAMTLPALISPQDSLRRYLQEIKRFPMLKPEEELDLSRRWREEGDVRAAHQLATSHLRLVAKIAFKYRGYGLPVGDLIAEGNVGMMQAIKRFDPEKGFRLSTYAIWWIKAAIQEYILRSWSLVKISSSSAQKRLFFNLRKLKQKIGVHASPGEHMTDEQVGDIARILDVKDQDVMDMDQLMTGNNVYLNSPMADEGGVEKIDFLESPDEAQDVLFEQREELANKQQLLEQAMVALSDRERDIITRRRLQDKPDTLEMLSQAYGVSRERVRQIEVRAFEKLQAGVLSAQDSDQ